MKRMSNGLLSLMVLCASCFLGSCLDDDEKNYSQLTIGTVKVIEGNDYYFMLDPGNKMYPGDTTHIENYALKDGQRAFIYFDLLNERMSGYDYNAMIYRIEDILTKDILRMPSQINEETLGNDRINITNLWVANGFLNIQYQLFYDDHSEKKHFLNLIMNEATENTNSDYLTLEFRHNAYQEEEKKLGSGLVSFQLDNIEAKLEGKKGLKIRYHSLYEGITEKQIDLK